MRATILCILPLACFSCSSDAGDPPLDEVDPDPACAGEDATTTSARTDELAWDLDRDPSSPVICDAANPDCDRIDEPDAPDELDLPDLESAALDTWGLADPLTSTGKYRTWPNGRIPYKLATTNGVVQINSATRTALSQAMTNWEQLTEGRIKFRPKQASDVAYVVIKQGSPRVSPFVGYRKDKVQEMYLRDSEYITVIKHELGHVIGLHHEQRRNDRLNYIKVRSQYIVDSSTCRYQFATCTDCKKVGTYDRTSVMHYRTSDLGNCRTGSVLLKLDGSPISHTWKLSPKDLNAVAIMYAKPSSTPPQPPASSVMPESGSIVSGAQCTGVADGLLTAEACDGGGDQDWRTTIDGQLRVQDTLQCAAVVGCSVGGALVEPAACESSALDQKWTFEDMALVHGATATCADHALALGACTGDEAQLWRYRPETETIEVGDRCLTAGESTTLAACDGSASQQWFQGRGGFVTRTNTARCLAVASGKLSLGDCSDAVDQRWALRGAITDARSELCLQAGAPMTLATCDGSAAQLFTLWSR